MHTPDVVVAEHAIAVALSIGLEQTDRLVVMYRPDAHPGDRCQLADVHTDTVNPDAHVRVKNYAALNTLLQLHLHASPTAERNSTEFSI